MIYVGTPVRKVQTQYCSIHPGQGVPPEEPKNNTPPRSTHQWSATIRPNTQESSSNGTPDQKPASAEGVRLSGGRRISRVSFKLFHFRTFLSEFYIYLYMYQFYYLEQIVA